MPSAIRKRLHGLWASLTDPRMDECLERDSVVPSRFLTNNQITVDLAAFSSTDTAADNLNKKPPVLFLMRSERIITDHPIDMADEFFRPMGKAQVREESPSPETQVRMILQDESKAFHRGTYLSHYINEWVMYGYPRVIPRGIPNLATRCNIHGVSYVISFSFRCALLICLPAHRMR